ncbi:hypothetical protein CV102_17195 [Natronococcus pandeyae]|uniref:Calcineurin-like phosphoesterase domain-containing protein n=1 Tax=Natronococcus pandeyae TaxID=2055836 RepID=A0A8J8TRA1_9EURY|nr:HAD-IA family hydrolase [Natronococcus pandeyae]TYL37357.1 hypothetical protein CV102_17195 [Natronococcus pandeyae]
MSADSDIGYDCLLLDMDGVLVENSPSADFEGAVEDAFADFEINEPTPELREAFRTLAGITDKRLCELRSAETVDIGGLWTRREERAAENQLRTLRDGGKSAYADVSALAAIGVTKAIVSNNQHRTVNAVVDYHGFDAWASAWSGVEPTVDGATRAKPDPWYLEQMADRLDLERPLYVGDRPSDMLAARRAGFDSAYLNRTEERLPETAPEPTYEIHSLSELTAIMTPTNNSTEQTERSRSTAPSIETVAGLPTLARLERPTAPERIRLAVVADPHVSPTAEGTPKLFHRSADRLRAAFADAEARGADAVVSVGDLTKDGVPAEYECVDDCLADLNLPFLAVPGNHDVPKDPTNVYEHGDDHETPPIDRFVERYTPGELPYVARVGDLELVGINTASTPDGDLRRTHDGMVSADQLEWLERTLPDLSNPVVIMHHNTPSMYDQLREYIDSAHPEMSMPPTTREPERLCELFETHDVPLVLTGHLHILGVAAFGPTREVTVPATCSYPQGYVLVDIGPEGTAARYAPVTTSEGMTEAHAARRTGGDTSQGLTAFAAIRLASSPLLDELTDR